jgi:hypothetical protein
LERLSSLEARYQRRLFISASENFHHELNILLTCDIEPGEKHQEGGSHESGPNYCNLPHHYRNPSFGADVRSQRSNKIGHLGQYPTNMIGADQ